MPKSLKLISDTFSAFEQLGYRILLKQSTSSEAPNNVEGFYTYLPSAMNMDGIYLVYVGEVRA
jgi:hypothetical protein